MAQSLNYVLKLGVKLIYVNGKFDLEFEKFPHSVITVVYASFIRKVCVHFDSFLCTFDTFGNSKHLHTN